MTKHKKKKKTNMTKILEQHTDTPAAPDPNEVPWFKDLKAGTGAAEGMDPALREVLEDAMVDRASEQVARADKIDWRQDLLDGTGTAQGMDPALREVLAEATRAKAVEQAGTDIVREEEIRIASQKAKELAERIEQGNPHALPVDGPEPDDDIARNNSGRRSY